MHDASITFSTELDNAKLEKELAKLTKKIEAQERKIAEIGIERDRAKEKSLFGAAELDAEKARLQEIKDQLKDIRAMAKDKGLSVEQREGYAAQIPALQQELKDQQVRVNGLQAEWNKTENSVDRYAAQLNKAEGALTRQKEEAGEILRQIKEAESAAAQMARAEDQAGTYTSRFADRIKKLASNVFAFNLITTALRNVRTWMGKAIKTNGEASRSIAQLKGALLTLAQPLIEIIIPAFVTFVNILTRIITAVAQLASVLFGKTLKQSKDGAKALYNEANAIESVGSAAEEAAGSLAGFDEINQIQTENAKGGAGGGTAADAIEPDFSWADDMGGMLDRLKEIADLIGLIGAGLALWKLSGILPGILGTIAEKLAGILLTVGGLLLLWHGLADAWENGVDWFNLIEMIGGLAAAALGLYLLFGPIAAGIMLIVGGLALLVTAFHDAMKNGWNLQNTLLAIAGILSAGLGLSIITGTWIPLLIAGIAAVLLAITVATGHGEELLGGLKKVVEGFLDFFTGIFTGDIEKSVNGISKIFDGLEISIGAVISGIQDFLVSFLDWFDKKTNGRFHDIVETGKGFVTGVLETIRLSVGNFADAFEEVLTGVIEFFSGVFTLNFEKAGHGLVKIFDGICGLLVNPFVTAINLIIDALNFLISGLNKIKFDFPDWVPGLGGKSFGVNLPPIQKVKIPRLAQGAVIPPNREFMAVLGDQTRGNNLEAPEDLIRKIVREESSGGSAELIQLLQSILTAVKEGHIIMVDGAAFGRTAIRTINNANTSAGKQLLLI